MGTTPRQQKLSEKQIRSWLQTELRLRPEIYFAFGRREINTTALAEAADAALDLSETGWGTATLGSYDPGSGTAHLADQIHDLAQEVGEAWEEADAAGEEEEE